MRTIVFANMDDQIFSINPAARFITGVFGDPVINQFAGAGPSKHPFKFKALLINGTYYIPDPMEALKPRVFRNYSNYPFVPANPQPRPNQVEEIPIH